MTASGQLSKQDVQKEILALNNTLDQMAIIDIDRAFHPRAPDYTFFSSAPMCF